MGRRVPLPIRPIPGTAFEDEEALDRMWIEEEKRMRRDAMIRVAILGVGMIGAFVMVFVMMVARGG